MSVWVEELRAAAEAALPPVDGEIAVPGLGEPVEVLRDRWGIPSIRAASTADLWFAQGFVTASERLFQIDLGLRAASGRLSELFSDLTLPQDRFARTIGFRRIGEREVERWSDASRAVVERFVEGAHAWLAAMPAPPVEYALLAVPPELPKEPADWAAVFAYVAWGLSGNWDVELLRVHLAEALGHEAARDLLPPLPPTPASAIAGGLLDAMPRAHGQGSNAWALSGSRTVSGRPLLANDPHLLAQQPIAWFESHLVAPGYEARGVALPFAPGILIGATPHHAWGFTNVSGDVQDLFEERLNEDGTAVEFDGAWEPLTLHHETIAIRGGTPFELTVRQSRHGPLLDVEAIGVGDVDYEPLERTYALSWTAREGLIEPSSIVAMAQATSFAAFRDALRGVTCPGQNILYADVDGAIGFQLTGRYPVRRSGDGTVPVPGWSSDHGWNGWVPFEELPWSLDPEGGAIVSANHRHHDDDFPHLIGMDFHTDNRARRIVERLDALGRATAADMASMQVDTVSLPMLRLVPLLTRIDPGDDAKWALEEVRTWDGDLAAGSRPAAIVNAWIAAIARAFLGSDRAAHDRYVAWREPFTCLALPSLLEGDPPRWVEGTWDELLTRALQEALDDLARRLGEDRDGWRWGAMHRVRFAHVLARMPGLAPMFVAAEVELGGDEQTILQAGFDARDGFDPVVVPSWRFVADLADLDASMAVLPTGQSGNPASPHWNDQAPAWAGGELRPAPVTSEAVAALAEHRLALVPGR